MLGLTLKLGILDLYTDNCSQTFSDILTGKILFTILQKLRISRIIIKGLCEGIPETYQMRTALRRVDIVHKTEHTLIVGIIVLERNLYINIILLTLKIKDILIQRIFTLVQISDKLLDAALIIKLNHLLRFTAVCGDIMRLADSAAGKCLYISLFLIL